jgi:hypothetical protein
MIPSLRTARTAEGVDKDAIPEILNGVFAAFPDIRFDARRKFVRDGLVTQEWTATGTLAIPYTMGSITAQSTAIKVSWNGADVIPFVGNLVARKVVYAESVRFLRAPGFVKVDL